MTSFGIRLRDSFDITILSTPASAILGGMIGYVYAKFADLPPQQAAKAWAIWLAVENLFVNFSTIFTSNPTAQLRILTITYILSTTIGIQQLRKRGLIGVKMMAIFVTYKALIILSLLTGVGMGLRRKK